MMQLHFDQPPGQQLSGREGGRVQDPHRDLPPLIGQLPGDGAQGHRRVGQVGHELLCPPARAVLDVGLPRLGADVRGTLLPGPHADQQVPHRVGLPGQVREDMRPRPSRQQGQCPEVRLGDDPGRAEQSLRRLIDLVAQFPLCGVHGAHCKEIAARVATGRTSRPDREGAPRREAGLERVRPMAAPRPNCSAPSARSAEPAAAGGPSPRAAARTAAVRPRPR